VRRWECCQCGDNGSVPEELRDRVGFGGYPVKLHGGEPLNMGIDGFRCLQEGNVHGGRSAHSGYRRGVWSMETREEAR
jgi:hypothetical protein